MSGAMSGVRRTGSARSPQMLHPPRLKLQWALKRTRYHGLPSYFEELLGKQTKQKRGPAPCWGANAQVELVVMAYSDDWKDTRR